MYFVSIWSIKSLSIFLSSEETEESFFKDSYYEFDEAMSQRL